MAYMIDWAPVIVQFDLFNRGNKWGRCAFVDRQSRALDQEIVVDHTMWISQYALRLIRQTLYCSEQVSLPWSLVYRWSYAKNSSNCANTVVKGAREKGVKSAFFVQREHLSSRQFSLSGRLFKDVLWVAYQKPCGNFYDNILWIFNYFNQLITNMKIFFKGKQIFFFFCT